MPKVVNHDQYRKELLSKCFELFADKGYASLGMRALVHELGISTGTLYYYFPNKQALFEQLIIYLTERDKRIFFAAVGQPKTLEKRIDALVSFVANNENYYMKQVFLSLDFYRAVGKDAFWKNVILKHSTELYRDGLAEFLGVYDQELLTFILSLLGGLVLERMNSGQSVSFVRQGALLGKMLKLYLAETKTGKKVKGLHKLFPEKETCLDDGRAEAER